MLFVPIGHDQSVYGRQWLTWLLIAVNVIVFAMTLLFEGGAERDVDAAADRVARIHREYPDARIREEVIASIPEDVRVQVGYLMSDDPDALDAPGARSLERAAKRLVDAAEARPFVRFGYRPGDPGVLSALTSLFMHGDIYHLAGNMLFLWLAGAVIECFWERLPFAILYVAAGAAGVLGHHLANLDSLVPLIGASGAIAGLLGAFVMGHPRTRIRMFYALWVIRPIVGTVRVRAWLLIPGWFALQIGTALLLEGDGVAYWAHVGGFLAGLAGALIMRWGGWLVYDADEVLGKER